MNTALIAPLFAALALVPVAVAHLKPRYIRRAIRRREDALRAEAEATWPALRRQLPPGINAGAPPLVGEPEKALTT